MKGKHVAISGHAEPGFEGVADTFAENFVRRNELGAACCMYVDGTDVLDLWGACGTARAAPGGAPEGQASVPPRLRGHSTHWQSGCGPRCRIHVATALDRIG
jgi:hypothetical protein